MGENSGIRHLSSMLSPGDLNRYPIFDGLKESHLEDLSPDVTVAEWEEDAVLFEAGSYLDLAFWIDEGEVELHLGAADDASQPIFTRNLSGGIGGDGDPTAERRAHTAGGSGPSAERPSEPGKITLLSTMDWDLHRGERVRLGRGEFFGEIGAMNGWPQSVTARTVTPCTLVQIRLPALRTLRRRSKELKKRLDELYRSRTLRSHLSSTPLLRSCDEQTIDALASRVELVSCEPGEVVATEGEGVEHLLLVRSGFLKLSQKVGVGDVVVSYLSKGTTLGEVELLVDGIDDWQVTTTSVGHSELVRIRRDDFLQIVGRDPSLEPHLWEVAVERIRELGFTRKHLQRSDLVEFALAKGLVQGNSVLVIDLETCTRCDDCVRGCKETHGGIPRFVREGEKYQSFLVTRSCYHCEDPVCLIGCPTGAIHRTNVGDVVNIDPSICIGCSACAQNCPYDAIVMHDLQEKWPDDALPKRLRGQDRQVASKCDLCYTSSAGPACVASCPHGCAFRVSTLDEFDALVEAKREARS
jgi:Fe-S-cluster-containing dehydrogenase component/CRP-like cAMP-binding protein